MKVSELIGKTLVKVDTEDDVIRFHTSTGETYIMQHIQDCCEDVYVDDINGDIADLIGTPILKAEETESDLPAKSQNDESFTWTFYHISTIKGYVTIKWYGTSNGYYSESVDFSKL